MVCDTRKTATERAGADQVVIDAPTLERARCDAKELGRVDVAKPGKVTRAVPPKVRRALVRRHRGCRAAPGCGRSVFVELHHGEPIADGGTHDHEKAPPPLRHASPGGPRGHPGDRRHVLRGLHFEHADGTREAQAMVDRAKPHVGCQPTVDRALRVALKHWVAERDERRPGELAEYVRLAA